MSSLTPFRAAARLALAAMLPLAAGCGLLDRTPEHPSPDIAAAWQAAPGAMPPMAPGWIAQLADPDLVTLVARAERDNPELAQRRAVAAQARAAARVASADRWPQVDGSVATTERQAGVDFSRANTSSEASINASFDLDLWGRLSDAARAAVLRLEAREAEVDAARLDLAQRVAGNWYAAVRAAQQVALLDQRLANLGRNLAAIEDGYRLGLGAALDVYLARNELEQQAAALRAEQENRMVAVRAVQLALGAYPSGEMTVATSLPPPPAPLGAGLPAELVQRRPELRAAWLDLLAADAALAVAHKNRFPRFALTAGVGRSSFQLAELVGQGRLIWSVTAALTQPLFDGGRLAALESEARALVTQREQSYLGAVYQALSEVESALGQEAALRDRYASLERARSNAAAAQALAEEQYRRGLVDYPTVLEAQRRAFDARTGTIELLNELVQNRIALHRALGGAALDSDPPA